MCLHRYFDSEVGSLKGPLHSPLVSPTLQRCADGAVRLPICQKLLPRNFI